MVGLGLGARLINYNKSLIDITAEQISSSALSINFKRKNFVKECHEVSTSLVIFFRDYNSAIDMEEAL